MDRQCVLETIDRINWELQMAVQMFYIQLWYQVLRLLVKLLYLYMSESKLAMPFIMMIQFIQWGQTMEALLEMVQ